MTLKKRSFESLESQEDRWLFLLKNADKLKQKQITKLRENPNFSKALERL